MGMWRFPVGLLGDSSNNNNNKDNGNNNNKTSKNVNNNNKNTSKKKSHLGKGGCVLRCPVRCPPCCVPSTLCARHAVCPPCRVPCCVPRLPSVCPCPALAHRRPTPCHHRAGAEARGLWVAKPLPEPRATLLGTEVSTWRLVPVSVPVSPRAGVAGPGWYRSCLLPT